MRYLRNMLFCGLLLTAFLSAAWNKLTFQGYITGSDGNGYTGPLAAGIRILPTANANGQVLLEKNYSSEQVQIKDGVYTLALQLSDSEINEIMKYDDLYLTVYLRRGGGTTSVFLSEENRLTPNIHVLGVPIAFKARGVKVKQAKDSSNLLIGTDSNNPSMPGGIIAGSGSRIGIGTDNPAANLHVVGAGTGANDYVLRVPTIDGHTVIATKVYNVKWE